MSCKSSGAFSRSFLEVFPEFLKSTGTQNGGNDFPGVARPFGMVKLGPDLLVSGTDSYSGYLPNGNFSGFSMMHEQGTGGAPKYGTVAQLPLAGNVRNPLSNITVGRSGSDQGSVGYYRAVTADNIVVELAASSRAGMYQYTFPAGSQGKNILIDVSHVLPSFRGQGLGQGYTGGDFTIMQDGHYETAGTYNNGWNRSPNWTIYSCKYDFITGIAGSDFTQAVTSMSRHRHRTPTLAPQMEAVFASLQVQLVQTVQILLLEVYIPSIQLLSHQELESRGSQRHRPARTFRTRSQQIPSSQQSSRILEARGILKCCLRLSRLQQIPPILHYSIPHSTS